MRGHAALRLAIGCALFALAPLAASQQQAETLPQFEVASIKINKAGDNRVMVGVQPGGRFTATNVPLRLLLRQAYQLQDFQIVGGPSWMTSEHYDILAKAENGENGNPSQSLSSAYSEQPWFGDPFQPFLNNIANNPIDTHELVAMIAPRGAFVMDNPHIGELSPKYGHVAALAGAEVYKALGAGDALGYNSNVASGTHCSVRPEWQTPFKNAVERFLKKTGTAAQTLNAFSSQSGDLPTWRDWTTPTPP